ncbi:hypothetical protein [Roseicyclus mahoneyensis]|jgi:hypothetical protein|uniref:hypothetical protein n=1 Tax=Roseicyclus mahoneyensis TaxID=164332 RepID=UPI0011B2517E|nr:hypothetical protein [Roseicyclus mahoneyensis]
MTDRTWRHMQFLPGTKQGVTATVTVRRSGEIVFNVHFSNGHQLDAANLTSQIYFFDKGGLEIARIAMSAQLAPSFGGKTRTTDHQATLGFDPEDAASIAKMRSQVIGIKYSKVATAFVKWGSDFKLKGGYSKWHHPELPPYLPSAAPASRIDDMPSISLQDPPSGPGYQGLPTKPDQFPP